MKLREFANLVAECLCEDPSTMYHRIRYRAQHNRLTVDNQTGLGRGHRREYGYAAFLEMTKGVIVVRAEGPPGESRSAMYHRVDQEVLQKCVKIWELKAHGLEP